MNDICDAFQDQSAYNFIEKMWMFIGDVSKYRTRYRMTYKPL